MRGHGNVTGADNVLAWQTGYPFGVNLGAAIRAQPRRVHDVRHADAGEADAALIIGSDLIEQFLQPARDHLAHNP